MTVIDFRQRARPPSGPVPEVLRLELVHEDGQLRSIVFPDGVPENLEQMRKLAHGLLAVTTEQTGSPESICLLTVAITDQADITSMTWGDMLSSPAQRAWLRRQLDEIERLVTVAND